MKTIRVKGFVDPHLMHGPDNTAYYETMYAIDAEGNAYSCGRRKYHHTFQGPAGCEFTLTDITPQFIRDTFEFCGNYDLVVRHDR